MEATGITRELDNLGRIVIPMSIRKTFGLFGSDGVIEIFTDEDKIILKKYKSGCEVCGEVLDIMTVQGIKLCPKCAKAMQEEIKKKL